jgi:flagellar biogenesis protein FliO
MTRRFLGALLVLLPALLGAGPEADLSYTPPATPELPSVGSVLVRLAGATLTALALCGGALWLARRGLRLPSSAPAAGKRLRLLSTLPLGGGSFLFLLQAGEKQYVAGVGRLGVLQTLTPLNDDFEQGFDGLADESEKASAASLPFPFPSPDHPPVTAGSPAAPGGPGPRSK